MDVPVVITGPVVGLAAGQEAPGVPEGAPDASVGPVVLWTPIPLARVLAPPPAQAACREDAWDGLER